MILYCRLQKTKFGWVIGGGITFQRKKRSQCFLADLSFNIEKFWNIEEISSSNTKSSVCTKSILQKWHGAKKIVFRKVARKTSPFEIGAKNIGFYQSGTKSIVFYFLICYFKESYELGVLAVLESLSKNKLKNKRRYFSPTV